MRSRRLAACLAIAAVACTRGGAPANTPPGDAAPAAAPDPGAQTLPSASSFDSTLARLERALTANGLTIAARVDHSAAASRAGLTLRPTTLVIAGNPAAGTPLMQSNQAVGVDLPLRFLVWQDADGRTRLTYPVPASIAARHGIQDRAQVLTRMTTAITTIITAATAP